MKPIVIIPAAGKSSRFRGNKPKWLRTHPDGKLMLTHAIETFIDLDVDIYLVTTKFIESDNDVIKILSDGCPGLKGVILLDNHTSSAIETVLFGLKKLGDLINGRSLFIKDSDNYVKINTSKINLNQSFTVGCNIYEHEISRITNKSFLIKNDFNFIVDFIEKRVVSDMISVGTHYFTKAELFINIANEVLSINDMNQSERYISHVIAAGIYNGEKFQHVNCTHYIDFGTQEEWDRIQKNHKVIFSDFDGTLVQNKGRFGDNNWFNHNDIPILSNIEVLYNQYKSGAQIIITTSRCESEKEYIINFLKNYKIELKDVICDCYHSPRIIINDFADTNPYPSCSSINLPRNGDLKKYLI